MMATGIDLANPAPCATGLLRASSVALAARARARTVEPVVPAGTGGGAGAQARYSQASAFGGTP